MGREATRRRRTGGEGVWNRREAERGSNKREGGSRKDRGAERKERGRDKARTPQAHSGPEGPKGPTPGEGPCGQQRLCISHMFSPNLGVVQTGRIIEEKHAGQGASATHPSSQPSLVPTLVSLALTQTSPPVAPPGPCLWLGSPRPVPLLCAPIASA